ncbi:MAG: RES family NAD+ phosphorylase [Geminicoccaceae bacterium]|nr:RES family NAD+ phosphorylase [Geminicoccaceae bacterium]
MSWPTWTAAALFSEARPWAGEGRRLVEARHHVATMKLVDTVEEQALLERSIEATKPLVPEPCRHLHFMLAAPFRYRPAPVGSRFRRAGDPRGVLYAAREERTAVAEIAFWRLLFFAESPDTPWPERPLQLTSFAVELSTERALALAEPPLDRDLAHWTDPVAYGPTQALAECAREANIAILRYPSVRDPEGGENLAVLDCAAFARPEPREPRTRHLLLDARGARAVCELPSRRLAFDRAAFARDPRIAGMPWERPPAEVPRGRGGR